MIRSKPLKPSTNRTCKNRACRNKFEPTEKHPFAIACCTGCEIILAKQHIEKVQAARAKKARKELAKRKEAIRPRKWYVARTKKSCHALVRARDFGKDCICCPGVPLGTGEIGGAYDAGHFRSVGSAKHLEFDLRNIHGQNKQCNRYGSGRALEMRKGLILRYGIEYVEAIESDQTDRKYSIAELIALDEYFKAELKALQANQIVGVA